jgi:chromate transport protein ChrA
VRHGLREIADVTTVAIAAATWLVFTRFKKLPEPAVILLAGLAGLILKRP